MAWFSRKKSEEPKPILGGTLPRDDERLGPAPPPPRTTHSPRVAVWRPGTAPAAEPVPGRAESRVLVLPPGQTAVLGPTSAQPHTSASLLVVAGSVSETSAATPLAARAGDLVLGAPGAALSVMNRDAGPAVLLVDEARGPAGVALASPRRIGREELAGAGVSGITGLRALSRSAAVVGLRLGPPPGARWVFVGMRGLAVFAGKLTLVDGEEPVLVRAGEVALVGDPSATLYVQAGNDSALALGFAAPDFVAALG